MGSGPVPGHAMLEHCYNEILVGLVLCGNALLRRGQVGKSGSQSDAPDIRQMLHAHLVKVRASLLVGLLDETNEAVLHWSTRLRVAALLVGLHFLRM
jgi:hypothetical protein